MIGKPYAIHPGVRMRIADPATGGSHDYDPDSLVEKLFAGKKAALRPIYDHLLELGYGLGRM